MYYAKFTNSKGNTFNFGYKYGNLFDIDGLTGLDVSIAFSQGFNQIGETAENKTVKSRSFEITGRLLGDAAQSKKKMLSVFAPMESGRLFFEDKYYIDCIVQHSPIITIDKKDPKFELVVVAPYPYWQKVTNDSFVVGGYEPAFRFPVNYSEPHTFGIAKAGTFINAFNSGEVDVFYRLEFRSNGETLNPQIRNALTGEYLKLNTTIVAGEKYSIYQTAGGLSVEFEKNGVTEDAFALLDEDSDLMTIHAGDNLISATAEDGENLLITTITFNAAVVGVYEGM